MTLTITVVEIPSHSKGWMAYKVPGLDKLQYGTTSVLSSDGTLTLEIIGEIARATRREKIRESQTVMMVAGETREIRRSISASNRYILSISAS